METSITQPAVNDLEVAGSYPGTDATVAQLMMLADQYHIAADTLLPHSGSGLAVSSAPMRLCAIHAIEAYLTAFLRFRDLNPAEVRGLQHNLAQRAAAAMEKGLQLRAKTFAHLVSLDDKREYLRVRYGPESMHGLSEINRIFATLREVSAKVTSAICKQPYDLADARFKKYW
ncbi:MAG: hypothetical protein ACREB7_17030 [Sphingopyxis sp.]|uniref:hypothetical protein n=1 Tax=Sphingopyxis sp. TaxID=1908224 RepID=UPI003D6D2B0A